MDPSNQNDTLNGSQHVQSSADTSQPSATLQQPQSWQDAMANMLNGFEIWVQSFNQSQASISTTMQALAAQINALSTQAPTAAPFLAPASATSFGSIHVKDPCQFTGKASDIEAFLNEITNYIYLQHRQITTDYEKSLLLSLYLADSNPKSWYQAIKNSMPDLLHDFNLLLEDFRRHFGNSDLKSMAYCKIKALQQTGSCAAYASHFCELVVYLDWTDKSKIAAFKEGLKDQVCDLLIMVCPKPTIFDEFIKICIELDNAIHENELDKHRAKSGSTLDTADHIYPNQTYHLPIPYYSTTATTPSTDMPALLPSEPMSINATKTRRGPLTQAEHDHHHANNLCLYCGGNHFINICPNMSNAAKKHFVSAVHSSGQA